MLCRGKSPTSGGEISNSTSLGTVVESSFPPFSITIVAQISTTWTTCFSEIMGVVFLPLSLMTRIAAFSFTSLGISLVLIFRPWIFNDLSCGCCSHLRRDPSGRPSALDFRRARSVDGLLGLPSGLWLCTALDCFVVCVGSLLFGDDGLELPYLGLSDDSLRLQRIFKLSLRFWMNLAQSWFGINGYFEGLYDCAELTLQYQTLPRPSADSKLTTLADGIG